MTTEESDMLVLLERLSRPLSYEDLWQIAEDYSNLGKAPSLPSDLDAWWVKATAIEIGIYLTNLLERTEDPDFHQQVVRLAILCVRTVVNLTGEAEQAQAELLFAAAEDWMTGNPGQEGEDLLEKLRSYEGHFVNDAIGTTFVDNNDDIGDTFPDLRFITCDFAFCCRKELDNEFHDRLPNLLKAVCELKAEKLGHREGSKAFEEAVGEHLALLAEVIRASLPTCPR